MKKKILVINDYSINNNDAVGITLRSIFVSDDTLEIFEVYRLKKNCTRQNIFESIQIPPECLPIDSHIRKIKNRIYGESEKLSSVSITNKRFSVSVRKIIKFVSEKFLLINRKSELSKTIIKFDPDYIYTIGGSVFSLNTSKYFSEKLDIPIVLHYMDNWRDTLYTDKRVPIIDAFFQKLLTKVENETSACLVISKKMKEEYERKRNLKYFVVMNTIDNNASKERTSFDRDEIIISYIGGIHLNRWECLLDVENVIKNLVINKRIKLHIYTNSILSNEMVNCFSEKVTLFQKPLPHDKISIAYEGSDILLHVEAMDEQTIEYTKYSMSTKIPEYLNSGLPIVYYGPKELAVCEYLKENEVALVSNSKKELKSQLELLFSKEELRKIMVEKAQEIVVKNHTKDKTKKILEQVFPEKV